jgi:hypothetical protein
MDSSKENQTRHKKKAAKVHRKLRKVFVDGLSKGTSEETIYNHFRKFGEIEEVAKFQHRSDPNKCYAFVVFEQASSCRAATRDPAPSVGNDVVYCALAAIGERFSGFNYFKKMNMLTDDRDKDKKKKENRHLKTKAKQSTHEIENGFIRTASAPTLRALNSVPMSEPDIYGRSPQFNLRVDVSQAVLPAVYSGYSRYSPTGSYSAGAIRYLSAHQQQATFAATPPSYRVPQNVDYVPRQSPFSVSYSSSQYSVSPQISMSSSRHSYLMSRTPTYTPGGSIALTPPIPRRRPMVLTPPTEPLRLSDMDYPYFQPLTNTD